MPEPIQSTPPSPPLASDAPPEPARTPDVSVVVATPSLSDLALECIGKIDGVVIPFLALARNPVVGALVGFKAGMELRECVDDQIEQASIKAAIQECRDVGGTPVGLVDGVLTCEVVK